MSGRIRSIGASAAVIVIGVSVIFAFATVAAEPAAQQPAGNDDIREVPISEAQLAPWLQRGWQPVLMDEYRKLAANARAKTREAAAWISHAQYSATVVGGTLRDGRLKADVVRNGVDADLMLLDPLNVALSELKWSDGSATTWGTAPDGRTKLLVDRAGGQLEARWDFNGKPFSRGYRFDLRVAPAAVSSLQLRVPDGFRLTSAVGQVSGPTSSGEPGWQQWDVQLGSETSCRLSVIPEEASASRQAMIFVDADVSHVLRQDGLQVLAIFDAEVLESPVNRFEFVVPADFRVFSVGYGKDETIAWKDSVLEDRHQVVVDLPESLIGRSRPIRISGMLPRPADDKWKLPTLKLRHSSFLSGQLHLRVEAPLELQSFENTEGFRRDTTIAKSSQGRSYTFRRLLSDAEMIVSTGSALLDLGARVVNHFDTRGQVWKLQSEIEWIAHAGSTYTVRCSLPPQWQITEVSSPAEDATSQINHWGVKRSNDGARVLSVEFVDALTLNVPKVLRVACERTPAGNEQLAALPVLQPLDCGVVDSRLIVSHSTKTVPRLEANASVDPIDEAALPDFVTKSSLWRQLAGGDSNRLLLNVKSAAALQTGLTIDTAEPSIDAEADTFVEVEAGATRESFVAKITPKLEPVGRVLVYLSRSGPRPNWEIASASPATVSATMIPLAKHAEWSLPPHGELWELQLSAAQDREFRIKGSRKNPAAKTYNPAMMFVPNSDDFSGTVHLGIATGVDAQITANSLREIDDNNEQNADDGAPLILPDARSTRRSWKYESPEASLEVTATAGNAPDDVNQFATLSLRTIVEAGGSGIDLHTATFRIVNDRPHGPFRFKIPSPGTFLSVRVNERVTAPSEHEDEFSLPLPPDGKPIVIDIQYQTPSSAGLLLVSRSVPIPQSSSKVLSCEWEIAAPRDLGVAPLKHAVVVNRQPGGVTWSERFFGPIGRAAGDGVFNPFSKASWRQESFFSPDELLENRRALATFPPAGFEVVRARLPWSADSLTLRTWSVSRARVLGCVSLLMSGALALVLRRRRMANATRLAALWLGGALVVAAFAPPAFAPSIGGAVSGTLIALLLPRSVVIRRPSTTATDGISLGSTATLGQSSFSLPLLLAAAFVSTIAFDMSAQTPAEDPPLLPAGQASRTVLIPAAESGTTGTASLVFVHRELLEELRRAAAQNANANEYLITSADYRGQVDDQSLVSIDAEFRVAVLAPTATTRILLPLTNANLGGPDACLVKGKPHPVFMADDQSGYQLDLTRSDPSTPIAARTPDGPAASAVDAPTQAAARAAPEIFTIRLRLRPVTTAVAGGARLLAKVPAASVGRLSLTFADEYPTLIVAGSVGEVVADRKTQTPNIGKTGGLDVMWSSLQPTGLSSVAADATVSCLVETHPTWLEYRYHVEYRVRSGQMEHMTWHVPPRSVVRAVTSKSRALDHTQAPAPNDGTTLFIDLPEPQSGAFSVDAVLLVPLETSGQEIMVAAPDILDKQEGVARQVNQIGIVAPSEFLLTAKTIESEHVARVSADSFVAAARADAQGSRTPLFAYRLQSTAVLSFDLALQPTLRKVRQSQVGRIGAEDVVWTYSAEVETTGSPAFEHTLHVDRGLRIESISVQEDKAERLVRSSRNDERVHLFLSDATTGTQQIELRGRLSLRLPATSPLPLVRLEDARIVDSTLTLVRQPEVAVELTDTAALEPIESAEKRRPTSEGNVLVGQFRDKPNAQRPQIQVIRRSDHMGVDTAMLVHRRPSGDWSCSTTMRFRGSAVRVPHYRLQVPAELAGTHQLRLVNAESRSEVRDDGSVELILTPTAAGENAVIATVSAPITPPSGSWQLPRVSAIDAVSGTHYLLISPVDAFEPDAKGASSVLPEAIPQWIGDASGVAIKPGQWSAFTGDTGQWTLKKKQAQTADDGVRVPLCASECWLQHDGRLAGRMELFAVSTGGRSVALRWPVDAQLDTLYVDGISTAAEYPQADELMIPIEPTPKAHVIIVLWSQPVGKTLPRFGTVAQSIPQPVDAEIERSLCTVVGPQNASLVARKAFPSIGRLEHSVIRLEGLVATLWESGSGETLPQALWELTTKSHAACVEGFESSGSPDRWDAQTVAFHDRLQKVEEEIKALRGSVGSSPQVSQDPLSLQPLERLGISEPVTAAGDNLVFAQFPESSGEAGFGLWVIDNRLVALVLCALALTAIIFLVFKVLRKNISIGLSDRSAASWALLGLFWWLCLSNSALGLVLILLAAYGGLSQRRRRGARRPRWLPA
ncbi:MAG: hypothetical protein WD648_08475 [Planctomycetaceae bacterium]